MMKTVLSLNESPITSNRLITDTSTHLKGKSTYIRHINTSNVPYTQQNNLIRSLLLHLSRNIQRNIVLCLNLISLKISLFPLLKQNNV